MITDLSTEEILNSLPDAVLLVDSCGTIRFATMTLCELSGFEQVELVGQPLQVLIPVAHREHHEDCLSAFFREPRPRSMGVAQQISLVRRDGLEVAVDIGLAAMRVGAEVWAVAAIRDRSAERAAQIALIDAEQRIRLSFEDSMAPTMFTDLDDTIFAVNDAFCQMTGYTRDELLGHDSALFTHPDDIGITEAVHRRISRGETGQTRYVKRYVHKSGRTIWAEVSKASARNDAGEVLYYVISERDITDRVKRDLALELLSEVNKLAVLVTSEEVFFQQLCDVIVERGGFELAWIAVAKGDRSDGVDVVCSAGATGYLAGLTFSWWGAKATGQGPLGAALRSGETRVTGDFAKEVTFELWRERAAQFSLRSSIAVPFHPGRQKAVLSVYSGDVFDFDDVLVRGFEDIVRGAEFAVDHVRSVEGTKSALEQTTSVLRTLQATERARVDSEQRFRFAFEDNMAPMVFSDRDDRAIAVNEAFCQMVGFTREELLGRDSKQFTFPDDIGITEGTHVRFSAGEIDQVRYEKRYLRKDGRLIIAEVSRSVARDREGAILYSLSSERDVTEERLLNERLSHQALHDPLTGLANRVLFEDRLTQAHSRLARQGGHGAVLLLDLDDFKGVNDTYGHLVGDQLLVGVARRLELVTRASDTVCRLGGDEFLYLAEGLTSEDEAADVATRLLDVLTEPFLVNGLSFEQRASVGYIVCDQSTVNCGEAVQKADVALYEAKYRTPGHHMRFDPSMHRQAIDRFSLAQELRHALQAGDVKMHYQPIVDLTTAMIVGFEALMRWHHPEQGMIPPDVFIPLAEQSDLIIELGALAMREAVLEAAAWVSPNGADVAPYIAVNLSVRQMRDPGLTSMIAEALEFSGLPPERLVVEITESVALFDERETLNTLAYFDRVGIGVALDDFGTGYSSLSYIAQLLPKVIKVDRSFVNPVQESRNSVALLEAIISMGRNLNITVLAEGIETREQFHQLRDLGCQLGQGYLFSAAVPALEVSGLLRHGQHRWRNEQLH